jgi:hypothetical protein
MSAVNHGRVNPPLHQTDPLPFTKRHESIGSGAVKKWQTAKRTPASFAVNFPIFNLVGDISGCREVLVLPHIFGVLRLT